MARWMFLALLNHAAVTLVHQVFVLGREPLPSGVLSALILSLGFPLAVIFWLVEFLPQAKIGLLTINSLLWASIVEGILRRFVDRPKDSDAG